jgi:hypothetical protein
MVNDKHSCILRADIQNDDMMRTIFPILMLCAIAGCTSQRPVWPTVPGENSPDQVTIVTNGPQGMAAFRVKNKPQLANTNEAPENLRANLESSPFQDYDRDMIKAIMKRWRELKSGVPTIGINHATGKVVVEFRLHADGRISDLKTVSSKVNDSLTYLCEQAVADPGPYPRWPEEMVRKVGAESRIVRFSFDYE